MKNLIHLILFLISSCAGSNKYLTIAHRGASGYLPEHSLEAKAFAYARRPDYIEQDVVLTKDGHLVILHDITMDDTTNVAELFPGRDRKDGHFYAIDFTLKELKRLSVHERVNLKTGEARYPKRFPLGQSHFEIATLEEEIELILGLNKSVGDDVGFYIELKKPEFHLSEGFSIDDELLKVLAKYDISKVYIQCFHEKTLKAIAKKTEIPLVLLLAENNWQESSSDYDYLKSRKGLEEVSEYVAGIGPWIGSILDPELGGEDIIHHAHELGLVVHPYTFRRDELPKGYSYSELIEYFTGELRVEGVFTDFP